MRRRLAISKEVLTGFPPLIVFCLLFAVTPAWALPAVEKTSLGNGLTLLSAEERLLPMVTVQVLINAGSWRDPPGKPGLAHLTANALLLGTGSEPASEIFRRLEFMGTELSVDCARDTAVIKLRTLKKHLSASFEILLSVLTRPSFPEDEMKRKIAEIIGQIQAKGHQPGEMARETFVREVYLRGAYGHPVEGTPEALPKMTREVVAGFHSSYYRPGQAIVAVVGDITVEEVKRILVPRLRDWRTAPKESDRMTVEFARERKTVTVDRKISQANIVIGHEGIARNNADYYALTVMNYILGGGGFFSRMVQRIREKRGLAYSVSSSFIARKHPGTFRVVLQTRNESADEAIAIVFDELVRMRETRVSDQELATAKQYLTGSFPLRLVSQSDLAAFLCQVEFFNLGPDYPDHYPELIQSVSAEDVQRVARTYLHPDRAVVVVVGNTANTNLRRGSSEPQHASRATTTRR